MPGKQIPDPSVPPSGGKRPIIGITLDSEESGGYSAFPWYAVRGNYSNAVAAVGGVPVMLPHEIDCLEQYLDGISGLIITGGAFDIDPALFGDGTRHERVRLKEDRTDFEWEAVSGALARNMPVLGICGGQQLLNVVLGGTLIQHIPDEVEDALAHEQPNPRNEPGHDVTVMRGTRLQEIAGKLRLSVNSAHHQAVKTIGEGVIVNAVASDGVVEGIEAPNYRFCLGVQWHPEFFIDPADREIFRALVSAAAG